MGRKRRPLRTIRVLPRKAKGNTRQVWIVASAHSDGCRRYDVMHAPSEIIIAGWCVTVASSGQRELAVSCRIEQCCLYSRR
ncbi:hypothetical protein CALVIDRAFT_12851 [Calocera viscosa TUFC12733]|uniref:Uncharacterized protein n=1 Tax=Calocera viscosa (strain TUFC12733) TaxID=1330018 RepID=A0A167S6E1_CALVF|nr:hypothetical protein CALVIDRAFT_12851 [Calocera viscosa TUFC12733]